MPTFPSSPGEVQETRSADVSVMLVADKSVMAEGAVVSGRKRVVKVRSIPMA